MKCVRMIMKFIVVGIVLLIPFIPINSSTLDISKNENDKIVVDCEDLYELIIIEGKDKLIEFYNNNAIENVPRYLYSSQLKGKNPIKILTRYKNGVPNNYIFEMYGKFEISSSGIVTFNIDEWRNIGDDKLILLDTIYMKHYRISVLVIMVLILIITLYKKRPQNT